MKREGLEKFAPPFAPDRFSRAESQRLAPFFTNLDQSVYAPLIFSPEVIGALCSRTSRAAEDLRKIFLNEYINPFLEDSKNEDARQYGRDLQAFIDFLHAHPIEKIFSNPRARSFYSKWLAQYGDDSIAQMAGMHIVFSSLSQIAIKHLEDQRIGLAPIEKSTRYVDYSKKINGGYMYYTDPMLRKMTLEPEYRSAMDNLFATYINAKPHLQQWLQEKFPEESTNVVEKKSFDTLRGLLPTSTLSQVAFFGNGQSFEYLISRCGRHPLGEIQWAGERVYEELFKITPSFLRRVKDTENQEMIAAYQEYLAGKGKRVAPFVEDHLEHKSLPDHNVAVILAEYDPAGEDKVIAGILYAAPNNHLSWQATASAVEKMTRAEKKKVISAYLEGRSQRWQKVGRAFENTYVRFDIIMNIGAWRDLHRHRMLTQQRQNFTCEHGYDVPFELIESGLEHKFRAAIDQVEEVYNKIAKKDLYLAQYAVTMAHRVRFQQWKNLRECFWEIELRTIPEGHPDYRRIEQEKFRLLEKVYPLLTEHMHVNMGEYDFARRGQEEKIQAKLRELEKLKV